MNVPESQREGKALKAFLAHRRSSPRWVDPTAGESPDAFWARMFAEYGPGHPEDVRVGTSQSVYWVDGTTIERVRTADGWRYDVSSDVLSSGAPGSDSDSVYGGVLSSGTPESVPGGASLLR